MSQLAFGPSPDAPQLTRESAIQFFVDGIKTPEQERIGIESEFFIVDPKSFALVPYAQVEQFLKGLAQQFGWEPIYEDKHVIALERDGAMVALEPGGQLELATHPAKDLREIEKTFAEFYKELRTIATAQGRNLLSLGLHPTADFAKIAPIPKARYAIMIPRLKARGPLAHYMMFGSCAWQCALDYISEEDFRKKFYTAYHITSLVSALYANSPWEQGQANGFMSKRVHAWLQTDPGRCGLIEDVFSGSFGFEDYLEFAFTTPMLFVVREGQLIEVKDRTFGQFMQRGYEGFYATMEDWILHLTSLYPEIRLKQFIEFRGTDANRPEWLYSFPAIFVGVFQESALMEAACDLTRKLSFSERVELHEAISREGLAARMGRVPVYELVRELVKIAQDGMQRRGKDEAFALEPIATYLQQYQPPKSGAELPAPTAETLKPFLLL